jgi:hypothetical protein
MPYWRDLEPRLEAALADMSPRCTSSFDPRPLAVLGDISKTFALDASQVAALADDMGVIKAHTAEETLARILEVDRDRRRLASQTRMSHAHAMLLRHLLTSRVTKTTALREWKVPVDLLEELECEERDNPYYRSAAPMVLFKFGDVVRVSPRALGTSRRLGPYVGGAAVRRLREVASTQAVYVPDPSGKKRGRPATSAPEVEERARSKRAARKAAESRALDEERARLASLFAARAQRRDAVRAALNRSGSGVVGRVARLAESHRCVPAEVAGAVRGPKCPVCSKMLKTVAGVFDHMSMVHFRSSERT